MNTCYTPWRFVDSYSVIWVVALMLVSFGFFFFLLLLFLFFFASSFFFYISAGHGCWYRWSRTTAIWRSVLDGSKEVTAVMTTQLFEQWIRDYN